MLDFLVEQARPLASPFLALGLALLVPFLVRRRTRVAVKMATAVLAVLGFFACYRLACSFDRFSAWLFPLESPLCIAYVVMVLPAMYLPRNLWRRLFLLVPAVGLALAAASVLEAYRAVPAGQEGWYWLLIRPAYLMIGAVSLLVLVQPLMRLGDFRAMVRFTCLLVLLYGGLALRQNYADYQEMLVRRKRPKPGFMNVSETSPVLQSGSRMTYLPAAPCRFTADGGYVQGCNIEMAQRLMQVDFSKVGARDSAEIGTLTVLLGALIFFLCLSFVAARWSCGWLCPLSSLGGALDWLRRKLGLPHLKPARPVKLAYLFSGAGLLSLTMAMARAYPSVDANERFLGCKLPLYPFCKICPSQQICPVAAAGPANYAGLPTMDWGFGFFKITVIALLVVFAISFALGRRLWCRLCPMGMISGLFNRGGAVALRKDARKCNSCGVCAEVCPMDIDRVRQEMTDTDVGCYDCVLCLKCVEKCPRDGCLALEHAGVRVVESRFEGGA